MDIERVKEKVFELLSTDESGHGVEHITRVLALSLKFAEEENADKDLAALIALLHDVDDYKLFGKKSAEKLTNARRIMDECAIDSDIQEVVCEAIGTIGYSKRLGGITPTLLEAMIASDADMCDALGTSGIIRCHTYGINRGVKFFDRNIFPIEDLDASKYTSKNADTTVCHLFEKILKLKGLMLTSAGKKEATKRHQFVVDFLYQMFEEENCPEWKEYLDRYLSEQNKDTKSVKVKK